MTDRKTLYSGVSHAAWGYFFLYLNINLGPVNVLPTFVGYWLFLSAIQKLQGERRDLALLRPLGILLLVYNLAGWLFSWLGGSLTEYLALVPLVMGAASMYFHFQLLTDCAALAAAYQRPGETLDRRLLRWRTVQTVLLTGMTLQLYLSQWLEEPWDYVLAALAVICLIAGLCIMFALFALRKCFVEDTKTAG